MLAVTGLLVLLSLFYYRQTVAFTAAVLIFLNYLPSGIPGVKLVFLISILLVLLYYGMGYYKQKTDTYPMWLLVPSLLMFVCHLITNHQGVVKNLPLIFVQCISYLFFPYVVWKVLYSKKLFDTYLRYLFVFLFIMAAYTIVELLMGRNYLALFIQENIAESMGGGGERERFGFLRCNSIMPYSSALGMVSACSFFLILMTRLLKVNIVERALPFLLLLLPFCVLVSGTRSQYCVFGVCMLPMFLWKDFVRSKYMRYALLVISVLLIFFYGYFFQIIDSIVNSTTSEYATGSNSDMREEQFDICYRYFVHSPIWGNGPNYLWLEVRPDNPALYGAESVWFQIMTDYGLVGCINYLLIVIGAMITLGKKSLVLIFFPLAFLVGKTLSIVIGIELNFLLVYTIVLYRMFQFYGDKAKKIVLQFGRRH